MLPHPIRTPGSTMTPWVNWEQFVLYKQYDAMAHGVWAPTARQFYTGNSCMNRRVIIEAGGFDPTFKRAEDVELAYRLADRGATFAFNPRAVGYHYAERSFSSWLAIPYAYGSNDVIFHHHKGQTWILPTILEEFKLRHIFIQLLVRLCLDHIYLSQIVIELLKQIALINFRVRLTALSNMAFSGIFNLRYYQGVADQLGGREKFFSRQSDQPSESKW